MSWEFDLSEGSCTFGCEHELADWPAAAPLPAGYGRTDDVTIANTNGVAAQPDVTVYPYGGEITTPPTETCAGQVACLAELRRRYPGAAVNHRSNLHVHVRVPGLKGSLPALKQLQFYIHTHLPNIIEEIEPIPPGATPAERKRARRRRVSHHTFLTKKRVQGQLEATTVEEFFRKEVPASRHGVPLWHAQPRCCVNLRQLLQTDTVEFRHFPGTLDPQELMACVAWCHRFVHAALYNENIERVYAAFKKRVCSRFPKFPEFDEEREIRYQATAAGGGLKRYQIKKNIALILEEKFNEQHAPDEYREASRRAGCVPR